MKVWILKDEYGCVCRMQYKSGAYPHASVFYSRDDAVKSANYFGGAWMIHEGWLDINE